MTLKDKIQVIPRHLLKDERGWFLKVITGKEDGLPNYTGEVYITVGLQGQKKGGHFHRLTKEWFTLIEGDAILKLEDIVTNERIELPLTLEDAITVVVPPNVAHEFVNNGNSRFVVVAYADQSYIPSDTISYTIK